MTLTSASSRFTYAMLALVLMPINSGAAFAQAAPTPEQVVLAHAEAWSNGDLPGLLALFSDDARSYQRPTDPHKLTGELSDTIGSKDQLAAYFKAISAKPLAREKVLEMATVGDVVIAAGESADPPDYAPGMRFLTGYRVRDGRIHDLWHIAWIPARAPVGPDPAETIRQLIAANNAGDADRFLALFGPDAKHFRYSDDPRKLADMQSGTLVDAASRERFFRDYFAGAPARVEAVKLFSVGDLVVEQSHVAGFADAPGKIVNEISIYRVRNGRIAYRWLLGEETLETPARRATR
ncbi:nuclear transport factor 2 family protein [Luteimonas salinilitoris]|uniref:Nuclear transport factor 2 family protein n=1 Tax=Luteimonas salinilitoris TaxID=3237697 RepID=A0ABV4HNL8_9GAMM